MAAAAFYDMDGTLVRTNLVHAFAYNARNQQGLLKSLVRTRALAADFLVDLQHRGADELRSHGALLEWRRTWCQPRNPPVVGPTYGGIPR